MSQSRIYIDADTIFDTRIATIAQLNQDVAKDLMRSNDYWIRESDHWSKLTMGRLTDQQVTEKYAKRNNDTLHASVMTGIIAPLIRILGENEIAINEGRPNSDISIDVNIYPYTLDDEGMELFTQLFTYRLGFSPTITFRSWPARHLTPTFLTSNYAVAFMYDFNGWLKQHLSALVLNRTQGFNLIVPRLFEHDVSRLSIEDKQDEVLAFKVFMLEYMNINFIDPSCFSMFRP